MEPIYDATIEAACHAIRGKAHTDELYSRKDLRTLRSLYNRVLEESVDATIELFLDNPDFKGIETEDEEKRLHEKIPRLAQIDDLEEEFFHAAMDLLPSDNLKWHFETVVRIDALYTKRAALYDEKTLVGGYIAEYADYYPENILGAVKKAHGHSLTRMIEAAFGEDCEGLETDPQYPFWLNWKIKLVKPALSGYYQKGKKLLEEAK